MTHIVRAFPLIGSRAELDAFLSELAGARFADTQAFYRRYGISHESAYVQEAPSGPLLIVVTVIEEDLRATATRYQAASTRFEEWFKARILELTGVDPSVQPLGPHSEAVFAWDGASGDVRTRSSLQSF